MRRRGVGGVGAIQKEQLAQARFKDKGSEIADDQLQQLSKQMDAFRTNLQEFASKYKHKIKKNPEFRRQFQEMCAATGVDPLASSKGFWADLLGVGDFYYELGVQIVEVCLATRHRNGGLLPIDELRSLLIKSRSLGKPQDDIGTDDLLRAINKLKVLGEGFSILAFDNPKTYLVQSIPAELNSDHRLVIEAAEGGKGCITPSQVAEKLKWEAMRAERALEELLKEGMAWIDDQYGQESAYWFPGLFRL